MSTLAKTEGFEPPLAGGARLRLTTVLVLSGIATEADAAASPVKPDVVCADIGELMRIWE